MNNFDVIVIGGGSAGFVAASKAVSAGLKVALAEKHKLGGGCPNYACVPSKTLLRSAEVLHLAENSAQFGIDVKEVKINFDKIMSSKDGIVNLLTGSPRLERLLERLDITHLKGEASFADEHTVSVEGKNYSAKQFVIAAGSDPFVPPIEGLKEAGFINSIEASMLRKLPKRLVILGGGAVGCEQAQLFTRLHTKVTLIQRGGRILDREDSKISQEVAESFTKQGINILTNSEIIKAEKVKGGKKLTVTNPDGQIKLVADELLVVAGRRADLSALNLSRANIKTDDKGRLVLDDYLRTSQPHIWAAGDAAGRYLFTHVAAYEGDIVGHNLANPDKLKKPDYRAIPRATFTHPDVGSVGITEDEAKAKGINYVAASYPLKVMGRALTVRDTEGFIKLIVEKNTGQILGGHMAGSNAGEVIHEIALAMFAKIPVDVLGSMIHAFPTMAEAVSFVTERLLSRRDERYAPGTLK